MNPGRVGALVGLVAIAAVLVVAVTRRSDAPEPDPPTREASATTEQLAAPPVLRDAPTLEDLDGWMQSDVTSLEELRGSVVVLQFWTYSCSNCKATLPHLQDVYARYRDDGLEIVGVHAPEFEFEKDPDAIAEAAARLGVTWPIALDTTKVNFHSWQEGPTAYWPRTYVIDQEGRIRYDHIGEGGYDDLEATVAALLSG